MTQRQIFFDLDGVLRDLCAAVSPPGYQPQSWHEKVRDESSICEYVSLHPELLVTAPATEYLETVIQHSSEHGYRPAILTWSCLRWIPYTRMWVMENIPDAILRFVCRPEEKLEIIGDGLLMEDYPFFEDNSQIILIDRPYNIDVKNPYARVKLQSELKAILDENIGRKAA